MGRLLTIFLLTLLSFANAWAGSYDVVHSQKKHDGESIVYIDPLVDEMDQLAGFIYSDAASRSLIIEEFDADTIAMIGLSGSAEKVVHYYSPQRDTLFIYALLSQMDQVPKIGLITVSKNDVSREFMPTNCFRGIGELERVAAQDIRLHRDPGGQVTGLWFEATLVYGGETPGYGSSSESYATTILYSPDLRFELLRDNVSGLRPGNLYGDSEREYFGFVNYHYGYDFTQTQGDTATGEAEWTTVIVQDTTNFHLLELTTPRGHTQSVFVGDFDPALAFDEVIYSGVSEDLEGILPGAAERIACYSFADQMTTRLWEIEDSNVRPAHIYRDHEIIAGISGSSAVILIDYLSGNIRDSIDLGRPLESVNFFETYSNPSTLNLVGRRADTVFVYRFDIAATSTSVKEDQEEVPATFTLLQNHPNPFNGETRLAFENEVSQYLTLKIYNILGQEVTTLAEGIYTPGTYFFYWNGADAGGLMQSSGVYFAKLQADGASQIIKLTFLK